MHGRDVMGVSNGDVAVLARAGVIEIWHKGMRVVEPRRVRVVRDGGFLGGKIVEMAELAWLVVVMLKCYLKM